MPPHARGPAHPVFAAPWTAHPGPRLPSPRKHASSSPATPIAHLSATLRSSLLPATLAHISFPLPSLLMTHGGVGACAHLPLSLSLSSPSPLPHTAPH